MKCNAEQIKNNENNENNENIKERNNFISNKTIINKEEKEIDNKKNQNKIINHKEYKKLLFDKINEDNSSSLQENINENINSDNSKNIESNKIYITVQPSPILSNLKNIYGNNISKNEFIFDYLNTNVLSNFTLQETDNKSLNQIQNQNAKSNKKMLKNNESLTSNVNSTTNISSMEKPIFKCTCKNSNCLKFYCECFANGKFCDNCNCINCKNTQENKELRLEKYNLIISRNPKAIQKINSTKRSWTCKCINSNCSKKYCDCFHNGRACTSKCRCINCLNKNISIKNNNNKKIKRIRGIKKEKINKVICRKFKRNKITKNKEKKNINENNENVQNNIEKNEKRNQYIKFYTPKKQRNNYDKSNYIYYQNDTTAALTGKKENKNLFQSKTDKRRKDVYTKLQMDNL